MRACNAARATATALKPEPVEQPLHDEVVGMRIDPQVAAPRQSPADAKEAHAPHAPVRSDAMHHGKYSNEQNLVFPAVIFAFVGTVRMPMRSCL